MYDLDVFAVLIPSDLKNRARTAFGLKQNERRFIKATAPGVAEEVLISSRDPTPDPLSPFEEKNDDGDTTSDRIVLRFSDQLNNPQEGIQLGTHVLSDICLGLRGTKGVSARQCSIIIDDNYWIWLHDYHSSHGSAVRYDEHKKDEVRKRDSWILSYGPGQRMHWETIEVYVSGLAFRIKFPNHNLASPKYMANLRAFRERCKKAVPPIDAVNLNGSNLSTAAPSQDRTPNKQAIYLDIGLIGKGSFGEVNRVIKVRDGLCYAQKKFFPPDSLLDESKRSKKRTRDTQAWVVWSENIRNEYELMKNNSHVSDAVRVYMSELSDN